MNKETTRTNKPLKDSLMEKIESNSVCPHSAFYFLCQECFVWFVWLVSIAIGSMAVAVSVFVVTHKQYELYEATHDNFFTFMVEVLPYIWIIAFSAMVYVSVRYLRNTKHGYRYSILSVILSSMALSILGGFLLQNYGIGGDMDSALGQQIDSYMSQSKLEQQVWQTPAEGRLLGSQVFATASTEIVIFEDVEGKRWRTDVSELAGKDLDILINQQQVRVLGLVKDDVSSLFHACAVFPMAKRDMSLSELKEQRTDFVYKVYDHLDKEKAVEDEGDSLCADIAAVRRMKNMEH